MFWVLSATEYIIMEVSQKIPIYTYSATLAFNGISIIIYLRTPVYSETLGLEVYSVTLPLCSYKRSYCSLHSTMLINICHGPCRRLKEICWFKSYGGFNDKQ